MSSLLVTVVLSVGVAVSGLYPGILGGGGSQDPNEPSIRPMPVSDPVCVLRAMVEASVTDVQGKRLDGVELWLRDTYRGAGGDQKALLLGVSAQGFVLKTLCLADTRDLVSWMPRGDVALEFFAVSEGFGSAAVTHHVDATVLNAEGNLWGVRLDGEIDLSRSTYTARAYRIRLAISLRQVR